MGYDAIAERLAAGQVVVLDGGMGTEIIRRTDRWVRNGIEASPETIEAIHRDYIAAGADVITTNTFQITRHTFLNFFHDLDQMRAIGAPGLETRAAELTARATDLALAARRAAGAEERVAVAGSISPLNHPFRSDLAPEKARAAEEHAETAAVLAAAGVDLILLETMNTVGEASAALQAAKETGLPVWVSLIPNGHGETLAGEPLEEVARTLATLEPAAILVNCAPAAHIGAALAALDGVTELPLGAYALIGRYAPPSWKMDFFPRFVDTDETPADAYAELAGGWIEAGAKIVGGCCGTTPGHIQSVRIMVAGKERAQGNA
ncbi:MAG: homocysteine S-methyltransferase family protein [Acidobacteriota bacterium]